MRHRKKKITLDRGSAHRKALIKNLAKSFFLYGKIQTTEAKAKAVKPFIEKLITAGKKDTLTVRRHIIKNTGSNAVATIILKQLGPRYRERKGGYTRLIKKGPRVGDGAHMTYLTLV